MTVAAIEVSGLTKVYGSTRALDGIDLTVSEGSVFGFLGPNGAGKTTTLRILNGLARSTKGEVRIFGHAAGSGEARSVVGFLPDVPGFYEWMTAEEFLRFAGRLFDVEKSVLDERIRVLLDLAGLAGVETRVGGYSRGMKQRLGIAQALVNAPRLLMLDEPTSALDPLGRRDVLEMIASLSGRTTVFFSTHILADVERVCDTVAVLDRGRVVTQAAVDELRTRYATQSIVVEVDSGEEELTAALGERAWVGAVEHASGGGLRVTVNDRDAAGREIPAIVAERGLSLVRYEAGEMSLEEVFVNLVGDHEESES